MKKKTQLSSFDILVLAYELQNLLSDGFIDKIYQPIKDELIIRVTVPAVPKNQADEKSDNNKSLDQTNSRYKNYNLVIKVGNYIYLEPRGKDTSISTMAQTASNKNTPRSFAMLLRKHLKNAKIKAIYQHEFERIIIIDIVKREPYQLIIELFGDGNVLLIKDNKIVQPLFSRTWSARTLRAGEEYKFPPERINPKTVEENVFFEVLKNSNKDLVRTLIMDLDIPGKFAEEICLLAEIDKNSKPSQLSNVDFNILLTKMRTIFSLIDTDPKPFLVFETEKETDPFEFLPIRLEIFKEYNFKELNDYNTLVKEFFRPSGELDFINERKVQLAIQDKSGKLSKVASEEARLKRQLEQQEQALIRFLSEMKENQEFGDAIYANYQFCEEVLQIIADLKERLGPNEIDEHIIERKQIKELNIQKGYLKLTVPSLDGTQKMDIKLSLRKNVIENANMYYERGKSAKEKHKGAEKALMKTKQALKDLEKQQDKLEKIEIPKSKPSLGRHFWFEKFHWFITSFGNLVVAGRDAKSNDQLVKKYLNDHDRYCHADLSGAPSVVVKHESDDGSKEISAKTLEEACQFALLFSKAWNSKIGAGSAYWVKPDQVSKTPQSGEYLARGAFVIRGRRNHVANIKLELAIGIIDYQGKPKLMAGPLEAIKKHTEKFIVLAPGDEKKNQTAKKLSELLNISVDDILSALPSGGFAIIKKVGFKE
jgi:predicted ribosome quality control (RQC) complex YloA/Tae2 family protein